LALSAPVLTVSTGAWDMIGRQRTQAGLRQDSERSQTGWDSEARG
jgi:hypothetical protein